MMNGLSGQNPTPRRAVPTVTMAVATGIAAANIYYNQPMLGIIQHAFPGSNAVGLIPTATQLGFAIGLIFLLPLGDLFERRSLILIQFSVLVIALMGAALAPTLPALLLASLLIGASATVAQQIVPFAAHLATPDRRGAVVGSVMAGLLCGILLSRTLAGVVAIHAGWRATFWLSVPLTFGGGVLAAYALPESRSSLNVGYGTLLRSLGALWLEFGTLRQAALSQALLFSAFSVFWTILALRLEQPPFRLGADVAGLFGVVGAAGIVAAPIAGRIADKYGPAVVVAAGAGVSFLSWVLLDFERSLAGLIVGVILLDFGVQSSLISNQHRIYALRPEARSRLNTVFMGMMFLGGATGSATASVAWIHGGWNAVSLLGLAFSFGAVVIQLPALRAYFAH